MIHFNVLKGGKVRTTLILMLLGAGALMVAGCNRVSETAVYIYAFGEKKGPPPGERINVNVWVNKELKFKDIPGDQIPILTLKPGKYSFRFSSEGYKPCSQKIQVTRDTTEEYVTCEMTKEIPQKSGAKE